MNIYRIEKGDEVRITFPNEGYIEGVIEYLPIAPRDTWILITHNGQVFYVQQFETILLLSKGIDDIGGRE